MAAFKGSNDTADWVEDFTGAEFDFSSCTLASGSTTAGAVHSGFCEYYGNLAAAGMLEAFSALVDANPTFTPVITGHSLGAAAAVLLAYDLYEYSGSKALVYTFGQPRVGDYDFATAFTSRSLGAYRLVHDSDMVGWPLVMPLMTCHISHDLSHLSHLSSLPG